MKTESMVKLQKYMSQAGICSRRKAEEYIVNGQVFVNGETAHIWQIIDSENDSVSLGEKALELQKNQVYYKFYKPRGIETTCAQKDGKSIIDIVQTPERVFPVWRLDKDSTGLILLTNDGRITNYLTHPRYEHEKEYVVETFWPISDEALKRMSRGIMILWKWTKKCKVDRISSGTFSIILTEGRNRQIRRMVDVVGSKVKKLKRIRVENILLGSMKEWELLELSSGEKETLLKKLGLNN